MQILTLVMSMLMLLTIITYGRLESFRQFVSLQSLFKSYMEVSERAYINEEALAFYDNFHQSTNSEKGDPPVKALAVINFKPFVNKKLRESNPEDFFVQLEMAKNLLIFLYAEQSFYKEAQKLRPDLLNSLFQHLMMATEEQEVNRKKPKSLANVDLKDPLLNFVFTKMLKGTEQKRSFSGKNLLKYPHATAKERINFIRPKKGYLSLLDFIQLEGDVNKIRVYLASSQVLMAIYDNIDIVTEIVQFRKQLHKELKHISKKVASERFRQKFSHLQKSNVPSRFLELSVSKTDPNSHL